MLGWIKDKISNSLKESGNSAAAEILKAQFSPLAKLTGLKPEIADRLARFVLDGTDEDVLAEVTNQSPVRPVPYTTIMSGPVPSEITSGLTKLVKLLPPDPLLYLRLARAYHARRGLNTRWTGTIYSGSASLFLNSSQWLDTFLVELSDNGINHESYFPAGLVRKMLIAADDDPDLLVKSAFFYDDSKGSSQRRYWLFQPYLYFQCLSEFAELVSSNPDLIRPAFRQSEVANRTCVLRTLSVLNIPLDYFKEEIAGLAVATSKEVREAAEEIVSEQFLLFQPVLERFAEKGNSDQRFQAARLLARIGGVSTHAFLKERLEREKSAKVAELIRDALSQGCDAPMSNGDQAAEIYSFPEIQEIPVLAPLDTQVLTDLRNWIDKFAREAEAQAKLASQAIYKTQLKEWNPPDKNTANRIFDAMQNLVRKDGAVSSLVEPWWGINQKILLSIAAHPGIQLIHFIRACIVVSGRAGNQRESDWLKSALNFTWSQPFQVFQRTRKSQIDLRELAAVYRTIGLDDRAIGDQIIGSNHYFPSPFLRADPKTVWPYFAERPDIFDEAIGFKKQSVVEQRALCSSKSG